jgi:hypothetical protein
MAAAQGNAGMWVLGALAALGGGVVMGIAANPTLRTFPELDWRERYRTLAAAPRDPAPQLGLSYYGDGSTAWVYGGAPVRWSERLPQGPDVTWREPAWDAALPPDPEPAATQARADQDAEAAERAAAQAVVARALIRSEPQGADQMERPPNPADVSPPDAGVEDPADGPDASYGG